MPPHAYLLVLATKTNKIVMQIVSRVFPHIYVFQTQFGSYIFLHCFCDASIAMAHPTLLNEENGSIMFLSWLFGDSAETTPCETPQRSALFQFFNGQNTDSQHKVVKPYEE
jgi:hypothetical protein